MDQSSAAAAAAAAAVAAAKRKRVRAALRIPGLRARILRRSRAGAARRGSVEASVTAIARTGGGPDKSGSPRRPFRPIARAPFMLIILDFFLFFLGRA